MVRTRRKGLFCSTTTRTITPDPSPRLTNTDHGKSRFEDGIAVAGSSMRALTRSWPAIACSVISPDRPWSGCSGAT